MVPKFSSALAGIPTVETDVPVLPAEATQLDVRALVSEHFEFIWRMLRRLGLSEADADDAAQRVFVVAAGKLGSVTAGSERAFLYGIAVRVASRAHRATSRRRDTETVDDHTLMDPNPSPDELVERAHARRVLDHILSAMPFEFRAVFVMYEIEGLTVPEIAEALTIPQGTVASRLRRARDDFEAYAQRIRARESFRTRAR